MELVRAYKLEKYMEIIVDDSLVKDKFNDTNIPNMYNVGLDFSLEANIFYGLNIVNKKYELIEDVKDFDNYDVIFRLLNWTRNYKREDYTFRILKTNKNKKVDFQEEMEYLKCRVL